MKIVDARTTIVGTPWRELTFLELQTDAGLVGTSEVRMVNKTDTLVACLQELAPRYVIGTSPFDIERLAWNIQRADYARPGEVTQSALAAFEIACWDLVGQALGVPVWKLLGGKFRDRVPAYANGWYQAEREPKAIARLAREVVARGYRALKIDPFGAAASEMPAPERRRAVDIVAAVRDAVGPDVQIMIEMHGRFTTAEAARMARLLEPFEPEWIEEPVPPENPQALARVRAATALPIAAGERAHVPEEIRPFLERGLIDIVQVDLTHYGGLLAMRRLAGWADAYSLVLAPHNVCGPVGTMANIHLAVATSNYKVLEHFNDFADPWVQELVDCPPRVDPADGCFAAPDRPGLGLRLNHAACAAHPRTRGLIRLFEPGWETRGFGRRRG
ncbi:MAG TPA: mandelate racemase/muconate lactonizing enzyme family protein [Vicinamibacterales bacterium]|nr:mandelate racemase/muconate lactonizing enzyme family protein [Vicinamibacterales bacterium]